MSISPFLLVIRYEFYGLSLTVFIIILNDIKMLNLGAFQCIPSDLNASKLAR